MHPFRVPRSVKTKAVAKVLVAIGVVIVLLSMPNWALIIFGLLLALAGWLLLKSRGRKRRRPW